MNKRELILYVVISLLQMAFTICWTVRFAEHFPKPIFSCVSTILFAHLLFWFGAYGPRLTFKLPREKGMLSEHMLRIRWIVFGQCLVFGVGSIFMVIQALIIGEPESVMFFSIPLAWSLGACHAWKFIQRSLQNEID